MNKVLIEQQNRKTEIVSIKKIKYSLFKNKPRLG